MKIKPDKEILNRKMYKEIKVMDRNQMESFLRSLYDQGVEEGQQSVKGVDLEEIIDMIRTVKGIGEKRLQEIVSRVSLLFEK